MKRGGELYLQRLCWLAAAGLGARRVEVIRVAVHRAALQHGRRRGRRRRRAAQRQQRPRRHGHHGGGLLRLADRLDVGGLLRWQHDVGTVAALGARHRNHHLATHTSDA